MAQKKTTSELEQELQEKIQLSHFLKQHADDFTSSDAAAVLSNLLREKKISKAELARRSKTSEVYLFQVLSSRRTPSRDRFLCFLLALQCTVEEARTYLKKARYTDLYAKDRRDAIILFALENKWKLDQLNDALYEYGEKLLS